MVKMTKWDKYLMGIVILMSIAGIFFVKGLTSNAGRVYAVIEVEGKEYKKISLDPSTSKTEITIDTEHGHNVVLVEGTGVKMVEADCRDQLCVKQPELTRANQINICLPNKVIIKLISNDSDLDIISY